MIKKIQFIVKNLQHKNPFAAIALQLITAGAVLLPVMIKMINAGIISAY